MDKVDWSKAPDNCVGAVESNDGDATCPFGVFVKKYDGFDGYQYCHEQEAYPCMEAFTFTPRPQPTLTYTQAMRDNGELPSVGMECRFDTTFFTTVTSNRGTCEIIAYYGDKVWINIIDFDCVINLSVIEFKPLTPPIELIHGEAYNFINSEDNNTNGIYSEDEHSFTSLSVEWLADHCTNIQPLTVKE